MSLLVLDPGLDSLIVDAGRPRWRSLGVPVGGAADRFSLAIGNALVGNPPNTAALEITLAGPTLRAECDLACVVYGAPFEMMECDSSTSPKRERGSASLAPWATGTTFKLRAGETIQIGGTPTRLRGYLCVRGGFDVALVLDSRSALQPLKRGDVLRCQTHVIGTRWIEQPNPADEERGNLRYLDGPQADWFAPDDLSRRSFTVTPASNRMGLRLSGPPLILQPRELVSEPVCPGAVQVTRDGQCIILGVDGQTIGGYPKIAQVISADLDRVGQLRPGESVAFVRVSIDEAEAAYRERQALLGEWLTRLRETR
jgi:antagonist of KipI